MSRSWGRLPAGKSTLAKVMDGLLLPDSGECLVNGVSTRDDPMHARRLVGLVFQEPEDQAVARRVEDDIAFGPRNLGVDDVGERVAEAMRLAGIEGLAGRNIHSLSGGQKQLVAIAGVLAMRPAYLVMDEPTAMLDCHGHPDGHGDHCRAKESRQGHRRHHAGPGGRSGRRPSRRYVCREHRRSGTATRGLLTLPREA